VAPQTYRQQRQQVIDAAEQVQQAGRETGLAMPRVGRCRQAQRQRGQAGERDRKPPRHACRDCRDHRVVLPTF